MSGKTVTDLTELTNALSEGKYDDDLDYNNDGAITVADVSDLLDYLANKNDITVALDPGHTEGYNTVRYGTYKYSEGTTVYYYARMLQAELFRRGYNVHLTRTDVKDAPSYAERAKISADNDADVLISVHSNSSSEDPTKNGVVVMYGMQDKEFNKEFGRRVAEAVASVMGHGVREVYWSESKDKKYIGEDKYAILRESARKGIKRAIIVEHGYHSNEEEARWLGNKSNLENMARAEAKAIDDHLRATIKKKESADKTVVVELKQLKNGSRCQEVAVLQTLLNQYGWRDKNGKTLTVDGSFGANTEYALKAYQKESGLDADGICGRATWSDLLTGK